MTTSKKIYFAIVVAIVSLSSCKKDDEQFVKTGTQVVQNYSITVSPWQWTYDNLYERHFYRFQNSSSDQSAVYGYVMSGSGEQALPYYTCPSFTCEQYDMAKNLFQSSPYIEFQHTNYNSRTSTPTTDEYFYLVVVPPNIKLANPNLDWNNYESVKEAFHLGRPIIIKQ